MANGAHMLGTEGLVVGVRRRGGGRMQREGFMWGRVQFTQVRFSRRKLDGD